MSEPSPPADGLEQLQRDAVGYFLRAANPDNGLVADSSRPGAPCSIAATGLGLAAYVVGAERGFLPRREAAERTLAALRFFRDSPQGEEPDATGHRGFYYHFLDLADGPAHLGQRALDDRHRDPDRRRADQRQLLLGRDGGRTGDPRARRFALRADRLALGADGGRVVSMGWKPGGGFLSYGWEGYSEALLLYVLGLGSPTHPLPAESYGAWTTTYQWENLYDVDFLFAAPLFIHQLSHLWIDFRGIQDAFMREKRSDYFENSRRATLVQQQYARRNPKRFEGYGENCWGITAGPGPGFSKQRADGGIERQFYGYVARGVPFGPDDGTLAPWAVAASLPFAPEIVVAGTRPLPRRLSGGRQRGRPPHQLQPHLRHRRRAPAAAGSAPITSGSTRGRWR